jgi:hypothetical protein
MLSYKDFLLQEAESDQTEVQKLKTQLSEKFDGIKSAKALKRPGDINSEIVSINKQAAIYTEISTIMKALAGELKTSLAQGQTKENIY